VGARVTGNANQLKRASFCGWYVRAVMAMENRWGKHCYHYFYDVAGSRLFWQLPEPKKWIDGKPPRSCVAKKGGIIEGSFQFVTPGCWMFFETKERDGREQLE